MTDRFHQFRQHNVPRAELLARGTGRPPRASSIICGMVMLMFLLAMVAKALTHLFTAT